MRILLFKVRYEGPPFFGKSFRALGLSLGLSGSGLRGSRPESGGSTRHRGLVVVVVVVVVIAYSRTREPNYD